MLIVRGIMWIFVLIVMLICMVKTKRNGMKKKIRALIFVVFLFILFVFMPYSTEAPIENLFTTFKTPEQAIHYINAPFSNDKAAVSRNELNEIIEGMRLNLPREVKQAQRIVGQAHSIIDKANSNGQAIIMEANEKAAQMISEEQIYKQAKAEAEALIEDAQNKANSIIKEASDRATQLKVGSLDYADKMLSNTETKIENLIKSITENSESLKGYLNQEIDAIYEERQTLNTYYEDVYQEQ